MASSEPDTRPRPLARDHGFHRLRVAEVVAETAEAVSLVLAVPDDLVAAYRYAAGQFCTFRVRVGGETLLRCYSMSSAPSVDDALTVTVKRVPGGRVSNHIVDTVAAGDEVEATPPAGVFCLPDGPGPIVAFAAGSGITPVFSLLKEALATTDRALTLLYANRDGPSTIFDAALADLVARHPGRLTVVHHHDVVGGFVGGDDVRAAFAEAEVGAVHAYVCGPAPFMDLVEDALVAAGVDHGRIHIERFTPVADGAGEEAAPTAPSDAPGTVTVDVDGRTGTAEHRPGTTVLQVARQLGLSPPSSCESGSCATCMARLLDGTVAMHVNDALTDEEVDEGWILTCQSVPTSPSVSVVYGFD